ncbi:MAG TPA: hypothetical protein ENI20_18615 [Bacteroides sp.]|nr:hypothetical protein [Bacteroides sp.]
MKFEEFQKLLETGEIPDDIPSLLQALLLDGAGDWEGAHTIAQNEFTRDGSWVHAYLHRVEGDMGNASYWYSDSGRKMPDMTLEEEWEAIARKLLRKG